jgi:hypothetical protein
VRRRGEEGLIASRGPPPGGNGGSRWIDAASDFCAEYPVLLPPRLKATGLGPKSYSDVLSVGTGSGLRSGHTDMALRASRMTQERDLGPFPYRTSETRP